MKAKIVFKWNSYCTPPKPLAALHIDGNYVDSFIGETFDDAEKQALTAARQRSHLPEPPPPKEYEIQGL